MKQLETHFDETLTLPWRITEIGQGQVTALPGALRLALPPSSVSAYHDAQITDYSGRHDLAWMPPVQMTVRARADSLLVGTAGFGFWNHPFVPGERGFRLPQAVWFFYSAPPSNMELAKGVPGPGWKAATMDASRWQFLALTPTAPVGFLLMHIPPLYDRLWPIGQRALGVSERLLDSSLFSETHTFTLDWQADRVTFGIDGATVHEAPTAPRGPVGFISWVDNRYAIVTPRGHFGFGLSQAKHEQALVLESVRVVQS